jgi:Mg2+-importing ATPase
MPNLTGVETCEYSGAIKALHEHGVRVKIITGDNSTTAAKVCRAVGLNPGEIILSNRGACMGRSSLAETLRSSRK